MIWFGIKTKEGKKTALLGDPEAGNNALELYPKTSTHFRKGMILLPRPLEGSKLKWPGSCSDYKQR